jgi:hypothetical protein
VREAAAQIEGPVRGYVYDVDTGGLREVV